MEKLLAFFTLFQKGEVIANPAMWKKRQITATMVSGFLVAIANLLMVFNLLPVPVNIDAINTIAGGVIALFNIVMTYITTDKIGVIDKTEPVVVISNEIAPDDEDGK